ncbi:hypothetical protein Tco_0940411 [Tanacetum coccineum]|uniref:No apical meristem-associated C-terminal domain-containing protein n=1 Tax=Tanacetum coccineum TaxID=301880 RepID=A0ABQ5DQL5_9ASTR
MTSTRASISKASKRPKINIIPPKQLFVDLTHDDTKTPSPKHQLSSPSAPNAPSKTPSTKGTSSSSIDYTPKSSTSPSTNGIFELTTTPPLRVIHYRRNHLQLKKIHQWTSLSPFHQLPHLMSNLILHHLLHLSLVTLFLGTFLRHMETHNGQIGADRSEDSFWGQIMDDFNTGTTQGYRTRHMPTGKWTTINGDCQKFNAIYKHLERKSGENEADHIEAAKITFAAQQPTGRKFQLEYCWCILKCHSKWDAPKPLDKEDHTEIFSLDDLKRKLQAGTSAYEAKKEKEVAMMEFKEIEFLTIDADLLPEPKASIIRNIQEKLIAKYAQQ